jgi:hypothetical protein
VNLYRSTSSPLGARALAPTPRPRTTTPSSRDTDLLSDEARACSAVVAHQLQQHSRRMLSANTTNLPPSLSRVATAVSKLFAKSTWTTRAGLWARMEEHSRLNSHTHLSIGMQATLFVASLEHLKPSSAAKYASDLKNIAKCLGHEVPLLELYRSGLAAGTAGSPIAQAVPATRLQTLRLVEHFTAARLPRLAAAVFLMWKTTSRWDDVAQLTSAAVIFNNDNDNVIIEWSTWKTNQRAQKRVCGLTDVIEEQRPDLLQQAAQVLHHLPRGQKLGSDTTTSQFVRLIQQCPGCSDLTAHSFKRGAANELMRAAARGLIDPYRIPTALKHQFALRDFPATSLQYIADKIATARAFKSSEMTRLL